MLNLSSFGIFSGSKEEKELDKGFCISISETSEINANGLLEYGEFRKLLTYRFKVPFSNIYFTLNMDPVFPNPSLEENLTNSIAVPFSIKKGEIKKICFLTPNSFRANLSEA